MGVHNFLSQWDEAWGRHLVTDPGDAGTIATTKSGRCEIVTTTAETRTIGDPEYAGQVLQLNMKTDAGDCTITVTNGFHSTGATSLVFNDAGDMVMLVGSRISATAIRWRLVAADGVEVPTTPISSITLDDNSTLGFGTGSDVVFKWNGTYLEAGPETGMWADVPLNWPGAAGVYHEVFDHFISTPDVTNLWTADNVGTGTTVYDPAVAAGILLMTCQATTDNACEQLTRKGAGFLLAAGKTVWYETRLKLVGDAQSEVSLGLVADGEDLTAVADVLPADGCSFSHQDGSLALALTCSKNGTDTGAVAGVHTMVSGTYVTLGMLINGITSVTPYINGTAGTAATATLNDDEAMAPYFLVRNGDGTTQQVLHVDYVRCLQLS